jgi:hypothetical protein
MNASVRQAAPQLTTGRGEWIPSADRDRRLEQDELATRLEVGPVDDDHRTLDAMQNRSRDRSVDSSALEMQRAIAEQPIDGLDVMLFKRVAASTTTEMGQRKLGATERRGDDANERGAPRLVLDESSLLEPV